jgi:hypothetical protein
MRDIAGKVYTLFRMSVEWTRTNHKGTEGQRFFAITHCFSVRRSSALRTVADFAYADNCTHECVAVKSGR